MAGYREMGLGVAMALAYHKAPEPFPLSFRGQDIDEGARILMAVLDECHEAGIGLTRVEVDPELYDAVAHRVTSGVSIAKNGDLRCEVRFFRRS